jgi:uncharacterized protein YdgA (DUF945 family)
MPAPVLHPLRRRLCEGGTDCTRRRRGQARTALLVLAAILCVIVALPGGFGGRAEAIYRDAIAQVAESGFAVKIDSYQRGWFSSECELSGTARGQRFTLTQRIHHGPLGFYDGWRVAFPVAAVVDTDPPPVLRDFLNRTAGDAPLLIQTVVAINGALDLHVSREPSQRVSPGLTVEFGGLDWRWRLSADRHLMRGRAPGITATGTFGEVEAANLALDGESRRDTSGLWLGGGTLVLQRLGYSLVPLGAHPARSGLLRKLSISTRTSLTNGLIEARLKLAADELRGGQLRLGPLALEANAGNLAAAPFERLRTDALSISRSGLDKAAQTQMMREKGAGLLIAMVQRGPTISLHLDLAGAGGKAMGDAHAAIAPQLADDPLMKARAADGKALAASVWEKYASVTAEATILPALLAQLATNDQVKGLLAGGILVRDGASYACHASYKDGAWTVNGKKLTPAAQATKSPGASGVPPRP